MDLKWLKEHSILNVFDNILHSSWGKEPEGSSSSQCKKTEQFMTSFRLATSRPLTSSLSSEASVHEVEILKDFKKKTRRVSSRTRLVGSLGKVKACVAERLTLRTSDLKVRASSLAHRVVSLDGEFYSTLSLFPQLYKCGTGDILLGEGGNPAMEQHPVQEGVVIFLGMQMLRKP